MLPLGLEPHGQLSPKNKTLYDCNTLFFGHLTQHPTKDFFKVSCNHWSPQTKSFALTFFLGKTTLLNFLEGPVDGHISDRWKKPWRDINPRPLTFQTGRLSDRWATTTGRFNGIYLTSETLLGHFSIYYIGQRLNAVKSFSLSQKRSRDPKILPNCFKIWHLYFGPAQIQWNLVNG